MEKELKSLLVAFEQKEGKPFLYNDERLLNEIERQWSEMKSNKKNIQQTKVPNFYYHTKF